MCPLGEYCVEASVTPVACSVYQSGAINEYTTLGQGATSAANCICKQQYVGVPLDASNQSRPLVECEACSIEKSNCTTDGLEREEMAVKEGNWRVNINSTVVTACRIPNVCVGGVDRSELCAAGHIGPFCDVCDDRDPSKKYYRQPTRECGDCDTASSGGGQLVVFLVVLVVFIIIGVLIGRMKRKHDRMTDEEKANSNQQVASSGGCKGM